MKIIKKIFNGIADIMRFMLWQFPISILAIAGVYFTFKLFINTTIETINITNFAFAIFAALSTLSFSYERSISEDPEKKEEIRYCAERFLHSAIFFLTASIIKYFLCQPDVYLFMSSCIFLKCIYKFFLMIPGLFFLNSIINCISGLRILNAYLFNSKKRFNDLKNLF
jgi:hypothetical protein